MSIGRLIRHLDEDAIARVLNGTPKPLRKPSGLSGGRPSNSYRWFRRNAAKKPWPGIEPTGHHHHPPVRPNKRDRSRD